jgi:hypothetical protein
MWLPPTSLIPALLDGAALQDVRSSTALVEGQTTRPVSCEKCERRYAYEMKRLGIRGIVVENLSAK